MYTFRFYEIVWFVWIGWNKRFIFQCIIVLHGIIFHVNNESSTPKRKKNRTKEPFQVIKSNKIVMNYNGDKSRKLFTFQIRYESQFLVEKKCSEKNVEKLCILLIAHQLRPENYFWSFVNLIKCLETNRRLGIISLIELRKRSMVNGKSENVKKVGLYSSEKQIKCWRDTYGI